MAKTNIKKEAPSEATKEQAVSVQKWLAGKYKMLRTYCGSLGTFHAGNEYELTKEQAEAFGKAGEIISCS